MPGPSAASRAFRARRSQKQLARAELKRQVVELRVQGASFAEIGAKLNMHLSTAYQIFRKTLSEMSRAQADEARSEVAARLDRLRQECWRRLKTDPLGYVNAFASNRGAVLQNDGLGPSAFAHRD